MKTTQLKYNRLSILFSLIAIIFLPLISNAQLRVNSNGAVSAGTFTTTTISSGMQVVGRISTGVPSGGLDGASATTGSLLFYNSTNANTVTINSGTTTLSYGMTLPAGQGAASTVLTNDGSGALSWSVNSSTNSAITDDYTTNATMYPLWVTANTGNLPLKVSSTKFSFNPSAGRLTTNALILSSGNNLTWGGAYGANIPTILGVSGGTNPRILFYPAGSNSGEKVRIDSSGKVGIGTTIPGYLLEVAGQSSIGNKALVANNDEIWTQPQINANAVLYINKRGYLDNTSQYRDLDISNGKAINIAFFQGSTSRVGIGTTSPVVKLDVNGSINVPSGNNLTWGGAYAANIPTITGINGSTNPRILFYPAGSNSGEKVRIDSLGRVGIGTTSPTAPLSVNGVANQVGGGTWGTFCDIRLKKDTSAFTDGLEVIKKIHPIRYKHNGKMGIKDTNSTFVGVVAHQIQQVAPYTVGTVMAKLDTADIQETEVLTYNPNALFYLFINAFKELDSENVKKDSVINKMSQKLNNLDSINAALVEKDLLKDTKLQEMQNQLITNNTSLLNQLNQLMETVNNCCHNSTQSATEAKSLTEGATKQTDVELNNKNIVVLNQNVPNPFAEQTTISYFLPDNIIGAQIIFSDQSGKIIKTVDLTDKGKGVLNVFANDLSSGIYTYSLIIDGQIVETKRMVKQ